jgi:hypothetical protein
MRADLAHSGRRSIGWKSWLFDWATYALVGLPLLGVAVALAYVSYARYVSDEQREVYENQWRRSSSAVVRNFEQLQKVAPEPARYQPFEFKIEYLAWPELEKQIDRLGYTGPRYAVIVERLKKVNGGATPSVSVLVSERRDDTTGKVTWTGVIKGLEIPNTGKIKSKIDLSFFGRSSGVGKFQVTFAQTYSGEDVQGDTSVPAQAPNSFQVLLEMQPNGSYSGSVPHPDLNNMTVATVSFRPYQ